jgi:hypothetical protein
MNSTVEFRRRQLANSLFGARRALRLVLGNVALVGVLVAYCELCSVLNGTPAPGLCISVPWAIQVSLGWIIIGASLGTLGERVVTMRYASSHPRAFILAAVLAIAAFAVLCEMMLVELTGEQIDWLALVYERAPISVAASAVLIAIYFGDRVLRQSSFAASPAPVVQPERESSASDDMMDVMTGTGRTSIRIAEIECLQADRNYINIVHISGRTYLLRQTMAAAESSLDPSRFVRIHRSTIVNRDRVKERRQGGIVVLQSGRTVSIGRAFRDRL